MSSKIRNISQSSKSQSVKPQDGRRKTTTTAMSSTRLNLPGAGAAGGRLLRWEGGLFPEGPTCNGAATVQLSLTFTATGGCEVQSNRCLSMICYHCCWSLSYVHGGACGVLALFLSLSLSVSLALASLVSRISRIYHLSRLDPMCELREVPKPAQLSPGRSLVDAGRGKVQTRTEWWASSRGGGAIWVAVVWRCDPW